MSRRMVPAFLALLALLAACSPASNNSSSSGGPQPSAVLERDGDGWRISVTPFTVQPGEIMRCTVVEGLPEDMVVQVSTTTQRAGGHHIVLFTSPSARPGDVYDCTAASTMANARFISPGPFNGVAENMAYKVPAGKPFIIQSHYVNATTGPVEAADVITLQPAPAGSTPAFLDFMALVDTGFLLPANQTSTVSRYCSFPRPFKILNHFGHMHELGTHYTLEKLDAQGNATTLDQYEWDVEYRDNAPINSFTRAAPLTINTGERLRITCNWNNTRDHDVEFPEEMCVTFIHYLVDDNWTGFLTCTDGDPEALN